MATLAFHLSVTHAETWTVCPTGCDHTSIASALDEAKDDGSLQGDVILVGDGTYVERLGFPVSIHGIEDFVIRSMNGPSRTTIDAYGGPLIAQGSNPGPTLRGFRIQNALAQGAAVYLWGNWRIHLDNCIIRKEDNPGCWRAFFFDAAYGTSVTDCVIVGPWDGAVVDSASSLSIVDSIFIESPIATWSCGSGNYLYARDSYFCGRPAGFPSSCPNGDQGGNSFVATCDCDRSLVPDIFEITDGVLADCDHDLLPDSCEIQDGSELDCNQNSVPDACDLSLGTSLDVNLDGIPDECQCRPDLDQDGAVEAADLGLLVAAWGTDGSVIENSDLDGDGLVGATDLGQLLAGWGPCN